MKLACSRFISLTNNTSFMHTHIDRKPGRRSPASERKNKGKNQGLPMLKPLAISNSQQTPNCFS